MQSATQTYNSDKVNDLHPSEYRWFAVYTKYKAEKYIISHLNKIGVQAYTPLLQVTKRYTRKVKKYDIPLINCYVFVKITKAEYLKVLETQHVLQFVRIRKNLIAIPDREISLMQMVVGEFQNVTLAEEDLKEGSQVEVIGGKLTGIKGVLIQKNGKNDFLINLEKSGFQLNINIDPKLLRPLSLIEI